MDPSGSARPPRTGADADEEEEDARGFLGGCGTACEREEVGSETTSKGITLNDAFNLR